jgi:hypothetical protein
LQLSDYKLSHSWGYLVSDLIKHGALTKLSSRLGPSVCISMKFQGVESDKIAKFMTPNPEEDLKSAIAYSRALVYICATHVT